MADLMSGSWDYAGLAKTYENFSVPAYKIKANGVDISSSREIAITEIRAKLVLEGTSIVEIKISNSYSAKEHAFDSKVKNHFVLGTIIDLEMGYGSSTSLVFKGYVAMIGAEFGKFPVFVVTLMDARRLMMVSGTKKLLHDVKNYSDAFQTVISAYSSLCTPKIEATSDNLEKPLSQNGSDYEFIVDGLIKEGKADREFFIFAGTAYFRKPRSVTSPVLTMKYGQALLDLSIHEEYLDMQVEVIGYSALEQASYVGKAAAKSSSSQKSVLSPSPVYTITDPDADSQQKADSRAAALADRQLWHGRTGEGKTIGLPEMAPGRFFQIEDLEEMADHKYYITEVEHVLNDQHFHTSFTIGGWE